MLNLDELVSGRSARIVTLDGKTYISAIDVISALTEKDANHSSEVFRNLDDIDKDELASHLRTHQFPGEFF